MARRKTTKQETEETPGATGGDGADKAFAEAIRAALAERDGEATRLHRVAQTLVGLAIEGNMAAIKEISERIDGKAQGAARAAAPAQPGDEREPLEIRLKWLSE